MKKIILEHLKKIKEEISHFQRKEEEFKGLTMPESNWIVRAWGCFLIFDWDENLEFAQVLLRVFGNTFLHKIVSFCPRVRNQGTVNIWNTESLGLVQFKLVVIIL